MRKKAIFLCLFALAPLSAGRCSWNGFLYGGGEALYWKPSACNFGYATQTTFVPPGGDSNASAVETKSVKPSADWGFRIFGGYEAKCDDFFAVVDWVYYRSTDASSVAANSLGQPQILLPYVQGTTAQDVRSAEARLKFRYDRVNLRLGYFLHRGCWGEVYSYGGVRYLRIKQKRKMKNAFLNTELFAKQVDHSKFEGAALEFGVGGEYALLCNFNLVGHAGVIAGLGDQSLSGLFTTNRTDLLPQTAMRAKGGTRCIPGVELRLGISYALCFGCFEIVGELGYELNHYFRALTVFDLNASAPAGSETGQLRPGLLTTCEDVGFAGPYASLALYF